jgi:hypothetical protein
VSVDKLSVGESTFRFAKPSRRKWYKATEGSELFSQFFLRTFFWQENNAEVAQKNEHNGTTQISSERKANDLAPNFFGFATDIYGLHGLPINCLDACGTCTYVPKYLGTI